MNLYSILELLPEASQDDIKKSYYKLALKYHPDKNKDIGSAEKFHSISMAYEILSDIEQRKKYDMMNPKKQQSIFDMINQMYYKFKSSTEFKDYIKKNVFENEEAKEKLLSGDKEVIREYIYNKANSYLLNMINKQFTINKESEKNNEDLTSIFIAENLDKKTYNILERDKVMSLETSIQTITTNKNENLLELTIITDLNEIFMNKFKEIIIQRQRYKDKQMYIDEKKIFIPLLDDRLILEKEGDDYIDENGLLQRGDVSIKIKCRKNKYLKRVNENDILLVLPITLYELFRGFDKRFGYLGNEEIKLKSSNPFKQYNFDGEKIVINIKNKGLPVSKETNNPSKEELPCSKEKNKNTLRGQLIIYLVLNKEELFIKKLKKYFG